MTGEMADRDSRIDISRSALPSRPIEVSAESATSSKATAGSTQDNTNYDSGVFKIAIKELNLDPDKIILVRLSPGNNVKDYYVVREKDTDKRILCERDGNSLTLSSICDLPENMKPIVLPSNVAECHACLKRVGDKLMVTDLGADGGTRCYIR